MNLPRIVAFIIATTISSKAYCWGFYAHKKINYLAVFLLPPEMMQFYKPNIDFIREHAVDPDMRRYAVTAEGPRHYIDIDHYGKYPYDSLPRRWKDAVEKFSEDSLNKYGIVPWWIPIMLNRLTDAFKQKDRVKILKLSSEIGHYIGDAHVPLHANSNHNGQYTDQRGIHGFWESRVPELLDFEWDFFIGKAEYISKPQDYIWKRVLESAAASDSVLRFEKELSRNTAPDEKFSFEERNGMIVRQYSSSFTKRFDSKLNGMVERRMRQSIFAVASFWYTAWINAGQPDLSTIAKTEFSEDELKEFKMLNEVWKNGKIKGREHE